MRRLPIAIAVALLVAIWAHALIRFGGPGTEDFFSRWMHDAVIVVAAIACLVRGLSRGADRMAWRALAAGLLAVAAGDLIYSLQPDLAAVPVPSVSDAFWLALYPCEYVAIVALLRSHVGPTVWATRLDGLAAGLAAASLLASVTVSAAVEGSAGAPFWEEATNLAYPACDLILLGAIVAALGLGGWRINRLWLTLGAAVVLLEAADLMYMADIEWSELPDALIATGTIALAAAATFAPPARGRTLVSTARGLFVPVVGGGLALTVVALGLLLHFNAVAMGLAVVALGLVLVRVAVALDEDAGVLAVRRVEAP